jgi:hypothetical protein
VNDSDGGRPIKRQCTARTRSGRQCRRSAIKGGTVCRVHGGAAGQVKLAAARRSAEAEALAAFERYGGADGNGGANVAAELGRLIGKVNSAETSRP